MILSALAAVVMTSAAPNFDCAKASGIERTVCSEPRLAALDARLADLYRRSLRTAPAEAESTRRAQRVWQKQRDTCARLEPRQPCLDGYYRTRIQTLEKQQRRRDESVGHAPTSGTYAGFIGRWRVVGVTDADDAPNVTNFGTDDPRYMGLELSAGPHEVRWLNATNENATVDVCVAPSFVARKPSTPLPGGWSAVTLSCKGDNYWTEVPVAITLKARDLAEMEWDQGALLHLKLMPPGAKAPAAPQAEPLPPPPADSSDHVTANDRAYFLALQSAVRRHDRAWFAKQGDVRVNRNDRASYTYGPEEIREVYDWIITPEVERAILGQNVDDLFKNYQGVMAGNGTVWFEQAWTGDRWVYQIIAINQAARESASR